MDFRILGPLEVLSDGRALRLAGQKRRALLALLLLEANRVVSRDRLLEALWESEPTPTARKGLQVHVAQLRKLLGKDRVLTQDPGYLVQVMPGELDLDRFSELRRLGRLHEALALWRGPPLAEFAYRRFARAEIGRLEELRLSCVEARIDADLAAGDHAALTGELDALIEQHPFRQRLRAQQMLALYRSGRDVDALKAFQDARGALDELGVEPSRELRELQQAVLNQDSSLDLGVPSSPSRLVLHQGLVGRQRELAELAASLDDALAGRGRVHLLVGEPGIGKSRLVDELAGMARFRGACVLVGRCWEAGGAPVYWPWVQALRAYVQETGAEALRAQLRRGDAELAQLLPELRERFTDIGEPRQLEAEGARFQLFDAVSSLLKCAAEVRPIVVVLDDLHAADEPSLLLLQFVARELGEGRLLVVGAYRDVDPSPTEPLTSVLGELARERGTRTLVLGGLSENDVSRIVELTSGEPPGAALVAAIHAETEGNPLFVTEIVRLLAIEGRLDAGEVSPLALPPRVRDVIARRLGRLSKRCHEVLVLACVLGRDFSLDALTRLSELSQAAILEALDEAIAARLVVEDPSAHGRFRFAHVLIRETLYEGTPASRRVRVHQLAVEALEALYGEEPGPHLAELAHHAFAGADPAKGLGYARRAGDRALALFAYEEAARLYQLAVQALSALPNERVRCALLLAVGEAEARAGNNRAAKAAFLEASGIARQLGLTLELARAAAGYGGRIVWSRAGADTRLVPLLEEGLAVLGEDDLALRARLLGRLAGALRDELSRERRDRLSLEAVDLARRAGDPAALAYALGARGHVIEAPDTVDELRVIATELGELAARSGDLERTIGGYELRLMPELLNGEIDATQAVLAAASGLADELRQPVQLWGVRSSRAMLALAFGRFAEAEVLIAEARTLGERALPDAALPVYHLQQYTLCDFRGELDHVELEPAIRGLAAAYPARPVFRCVLAHLSARLGRSEAAQQVLDELGKDDFAAVPFDQEWLFATSLLAETAVVLADARAAAILRRLLLPWAALNAVDPAEGIRGSVSRYLGLLAAVVGDRGEADRHFAAALEANERMGFRPWLAHTRHDYGMLLAGGPRRTHGAKAEMLLSRALADYRELEMETYAASAEALLVAVSELPA
jgi:DNA-binding SARP family transcriptional activator